MRTFIAAQRGIALLAATIVLMLAFGGMSVAQSVASDVRVVNTSREAVPVRVGHPVDVQATAPLDVTVTDPVDVTVTDPVNVTPPTLHGTHLNYGSTYSMAGNGGYDFWVQSPKLGVPEGRSMTARHVSMNITTPDRSCSVHYMQLVGKPPEHWTSVGTYHTATRVAPQRWVVDAEVSMPGALGVRGLVQCTHIPSSSSKVYVDATVTGELLPLPS